MNGSNTKSNSSVAVNIAIVGIEIGKVADFVILENDIMKCEIDNVPKTKVVYTFVNGENVYTNK